MLFEDSACTSNSVQLRDAVDRGRSAGAAHLRHEPRDAPLGAGPSAGVDQLRATAAGEWPYALVWLTGPLRWTPRHSVSEQSSGTASSPMSRPSKRRA